MAFIQDGTGQGKLAKVTADNRLLGDIISEPLSAERSRQGKLFGAGTGRLTLPTSFSGPVLWLRNDSTTEYMYVTKIIAGWNGGTSSRNTECFSLINYNTSVPTGANSTTDFNIENIALTGASSAVTLADATVHKWDNATGTAGMTGSTGGFAQIPNTFAIGDTTLNIGGEIILGANSTMRFDVTPAEAGLFHLAVVIYMAPPGGREDITS